MTEAPPVYVCSLPSGHGQMIPANTWKTLEFRYHNESYDEWGMHQPNQPDGGTSTFPDERSGLIWPNVRGWALVEGMVDLDQGNYSELWFQLCRDPLSLTTGKDETRKERRPVHSGPQYFAFQHWLRLSPGTPIAIQLKHNATAPVKVLYAQFKVAIFPDPGEAVHEPAPVPSTEEDALDMSTFTYFKKTETQTAAKATTNWVSFQTSNISNPVVSVAFENTKVMGSLYLRAVGGGRFGTRACKVKKNSSGAWVITESLPDHHFECGGSGNEARVEYPVNTVMGSGERLRISVWPIDNDLNLTHAEFNSFQSPA